MPQLMDIIYKVPIKEVKGPTDVEVKALTFDSRAVIAGGAFVAIKGTQTDGHRYIDKAVEAGAVAVVCEVLPNQLHEHITYIQTEDASVALGMMAANFYDNPSEKIRLVGVTGTNGKTSTVTLLYKLFKRLGYKCGLLSTVRNLVHDKEFPATHTTPDPVRLNEMLAQMADAGCEFCFMEVSSHAVAQNRIKGLHFTGAVFTNISHDHLDYHGTFAEYIKAKKQFFDDLPRGSFALVNADDKRGDVMLQNTKATKHSFSLKGAGDFNGKILENTFSGLLMNIDGEELHSRLIGEFNGYNLLTVYATTQLLHADKRETLEALSALSSAEGRFEYVISPKESIVGIIDYAHTPDALEKVLDTIQSIRTGEETLFTLVGCGGNRDKTKRPEMARIAAEKSDRVVLTSDNPRFEEPEAILKDMEKGLVAPLNRKAITIADRREAIKTACMMANEKDIILIAGKGHETYQEVRGERHHFDDKEELLNAFKNLNK